MFSKSTTLAVLALLATVVEAAPIDQGHLLPVARAQLVRRGAKKCARPSTSAAVEPTPTTSEAAPTTTTTVAVTEAATTEAPSSSATSEAESSTTTTTSEAATTTSTEEAAPTTSAANDNIGNNLNAAPAAPTPTKGNKGGKKGQQQQDQQQQDDSANQQQDQPQQQDQKPQDKPQEQKPAPAEDKPQDKPQNSGSGGYNIQGVASFYSVQNPAENHGYSGAVACSGAKYTDNDWIAAVGDAHYQGGANCGKKIEIKDNKTGNVQQVTIVDRCAGCEYGLVDLTPPVWRALHNGNDQDGLFDISWKFV